MAVNKVNLVRLKSGNAPTQGAVVVYEAGSTGLYNTKPSGDFVAEINPQIKASKIYNDVPFLDEAKQAVKYGKVQDNIVAPFGQILDLGAHDDLVFPHGAYSTQWVSEGSPVVASGKDGDVWYVIA
jgi:hypothetical protein|tara:strand:+ start:187 stop:564 length:378 start_codon:yes stop_codon:yes gene_type:complete